MIEPAYIQFLRIGSVTLTAPYWVDADQHIRRGDPLAFRPGDRFKIEFTDGTHVIYTIKRR